MKLAYSLFLILITALIGNAQPRPPDFLVKTNGDTLRGKFRNLTRQGEPSLVLYDGRQSLSFAPEEVVSYGEVGGLLYVKRQVGRQGQQVFVRPLVTGYVSLYARVDGQATRFYLQPSDSAYAIEVTPASAQLTFHRLLGGCADMHFGTDESRRRYPYSYQGMQRLVIQYNECRMPNQPVQVISPSAGWRVNWGVKAGINRSSFVEYENIVQSRASNKNTGYQICTMLHFQNRSPLSMQVEANLFLLRGSSNPTSLYTGTNAYSQITRIDIRFFQLQIPFLLCYRIGHGAVQPYLNAGPSIGINLNNSTSIINQYQYANRKEEETIPLAKSDIISLGYAGGLGVLFKRHTGPHFNIEVRYDHMIDRMRASYFRPQHNTLHLDLGILF